VSVLRLLLAEAARYGVSAAQIGSVGFITPYSEQVSEIRRVLIAEGYSFAHNYGKRERDASNGNIAQNAVVIDEDPLCVDIELNTVDGFQGKEKDFVIISCVRANDANTVGFLSDFRRMNVAITRARYGLFVIGHGATLRTNELWRDLIRHADRAKMCISLKTSADDLMTAMTHHVSVTSANKFFVQKQNVTQSSSTATNKRSLMDVHNSELDGQLSKQLRMEPQVIPALSTYSLDHSVIESYSALETCREVVESKEPDFSPICTSPPSSQPPVTETSIPGIRPRHKSNSKNVVDLEEGEIEE
jgi:hypothetical protein